MNLNQPLVSICCLAFNHENFIEDTINGFLKQKTSFPFEILIHDDASTDKTNMLLNKLESLHPQIKVIYQNENKYSKGEKPLIKYLFPEVKGKYIALCEGDDYWTDAYKLQQQVDFLEHNSKYVLCFHDAKENNENGIIYNNGGNNLTKDDLILNSHLHTSTIMFRWDDLIKSKIQNITVKNGDTALYSILGKFGEGKYMIDISPSIYRIHNQGVWSGKNEGFKLQSAINTYKWILINSDDKYSFSLRKKILVKTVNLAIIQYKSREIVEFSSSLWSILKLSLSINQYKYLLYLVKEILFK